MIDDCIAQRAHAFNRIDVAVNIAGIGGSGKSTHEMDMAEWRKVLDVNLHGLWMCQRAQVRQMLKQEYVFSFV
jgi:NAD(P)-dependent dehydrogenase (short-subunit alcohol dehydrogenase family)